MPDHPWRLLLDLDYLVEWVPAEPPATTLSFWICPATLVFDQAWDLTADIDLQGWSFQLFLNDYGSASWPGRSSGSLIAAQFHWIEHPGSDLFWLLGDALGHLRTRRSCDP